MTNIKDEDIKTARSVDLAEFLKYKGIKLEKAGNGRHRDAIHDSLVFTKNMYYWNSQKENGNALTYVTKYLSIEFKEAVKELCEFSGRIIPNEEKNENRQIGVGLKDNIKRSFAYLNKTRGISAELIKFLEKNNLIAETEFNNNLAFLIKDENSNIVGMELNTTLSNRRFKGFAKDSRHGYGFNIRKVKEPKHAFYFESGIDMLSFIQELGAKRFTERLQDSIFISMGGLKEATVRNMQNIYQAENIYICVDNPAFEKPLPDGSKPAQNFINKLKNEFSFKVFAPKGFKDWNEQLLKGFKVESISEISEIKNFKSSKALEIDDKNNNKFDIERFWQTDIYKNIAKTFNYTEKVLKGEDIGILMNEEAETFIISENVINTFAIAKIMLERGKDLSNYSFLSLNNLDINSSSAYIKILLGNYKNLKNSVLVFNNNSESKKLAEFLVNDINELTSVIKYFSKRASFDYDLRIKEGKKNGRIQENDERTHDRNGTNRVGVARKREELSANEQVWAHDTEKFKEGKQTKIRRTIDSRQALQDSSGQGETSRRAIQSDNGSTDDKGESRSDRGLYEEGRNNKNDPDGSRQPSNAGYSFKADLEDYGGVKTKYKNNVEAILTLKRLEESENIIASAVDKEILKQYTGWGGIPQAFDSENKLWQKEYQELKDILTEEEYESARASTPNAHYTNSTIIKAIYSALEQFGFSEGKILEPSCGIGNFFRYMPQSLENAQLYGVELDLLSGRIASKIYDKANIQIKGFEKTSFPDDTFDVVIGNVPFGNYQVYDEKFAKNNFLIHDYFFAKSLDKVKPNGIIAFITSKGTLDKANNSFRKYIAKRSELIGAVRLPNTTFKGIANTEVTTDIIFLQKRAWEILDEPGWIHLAQTKEGIPVNQYFIGNPEMLMGKMVLDKSMYGNSKSTALVSESDFNLTEGLSKAISRLTIARKLEYKKDLSGYLIGDIPVTPDSRNFTYTLIDNELYFRNNDVFEKVDLQGKNIEKVKQLHLIRNVLRDVINIQTKPDYGESELLEAQSKLNNLYDEFVKENGFIHQNKKLFDKDVDIGLLLSLERSIEDTYVKADIFYKATIKPREELRINSSQEALIAVINIQGKVDLQYMEEVYNKPKDVILTELGNEIFLNPTSNEYELRSIYLSGNVKEKLKKAKEAGAAFKNNVAELLKVQPKDLEIHDIGFKLGSNWLPVELYKEFIFDVLQTPIWYTWSGGKNEIKLVYNEFNSKYTLYNKSVDLENILANTKFGTKRASAYKIIETTLNHNFITIYDTTEDKKSVINLKETQLARIKQDELKKEFVNWILADDKRIKVIENIYNEKFNVSVPCRYDGKNLMLPAMNKSIELKDHQKDAVMRILLGGNTLLAHEVGAGKTYVMVAGAMALKQAGIVKKPMFVVPNHLTEQIGSEFLELFPAANVLIPSEKEFKKENRQNFVSKIATGEYDAVVLAFSQFEKIPMNDKFIEQQLKKDINEIVEAITELQNDINKNSLTIKQYESLKKSLEANLEKLTSKKNKDEVLKFEELGVDYLFVDEAHNYKNCFFHTKMTNVAGISTSNPKKSYDMLMKIRFLTEKNGGKGVTFATGTPITNSISEMFVMQRYLQEDTLKKMNINHFDKWASCFGDITTAMELDVTGKNYQMKTRFANFHNMPELLKLFNQVADMKSCDDLDIKRPDIIGGKAQSIILEPSIYVQEKMLELEMRADLVKNSSIEKAEDNMLVITNEGKAVAIDPRLVDPEAVVDEESKIYVCTDKVFEIYKKYAKDKALQLIFLDLGIKLYETIKEDLIKKGVIASEVALISDAKNKEAKELLFEKCRKGEIRVLIGSTEKMGAGTNIQDRMIAIHHLSCPYRPADIEQRNGRIRRRGNMYDEVYIFQYSTEKTFDSYLWQILEKKQMFISQLMKNDFTTRSYEDIDDATLEYAEIKALCCGDMRIKEKADLDIQIQRLLVEKNLFLKEQSKFRTIINENPNKIKLNEKAIANLMKDLAKISKSYNREFEITLDGKTYEKRIDAGIVLKNIVTKAPIGTKEIGNFKGLKIYVNKEFLKSYLTVDGYYKVVVDFGENELGNIRKIENLKVKYQKIIDNLLLKNKNLEAELKHAASIVNRVFEKEDILVSKVERQTIINFELENSYNVDKKEIINEKNKNISARNFKGIDCKNLNDKKEISL